jgi:hypothetical protein
VRELEKIVSRETSDGRGRGFYASMFHVKHRGRGPENAILQNNPMHQKITLTLQ